MDSQNRLVYRATDNKIEILACRQKTSRTRNLSLRRLFI
ncbi:type II toxin-antitoxin system YoeB family toxin [Enterococcus gallinarum]|nr:type II toxin-antitoxin system YoeB family toxin [Enterococcus gallinarum]